MMSDKRKTSLLSAVAVTPRAANRPLRVASGKWTIIRIFFIGITRMDGWMDGSMDGWMDVSIDRWMDGSMDRWMDGWINGWMDQWIDGSMDRWMDGWTDGWINGWLDGNGPICRARITNKNVGRHCQTCTKNAID